MTDRHDAPAAPAAPATPATPDGPGMPGMPGMSDRPDQSAAPGDRPNTTAPEASVPAAAPAPPAPGVPGRTPLLVTPEESGQKLLQFLQRRLGGAVPGSALLRVIRTGQVRVDGGRRQPFHRVQAGQKVRVPPLSGVAVAPAPLSAPAAHANASAGQNAAPGAAPGVGTSLDILLATPELVAVRKPAGLCSHAGTRHRDSVADRLAALYAGDPFTPVLAHRLDKDTSGILLAARSYASLRRFNDLFAAGGVTKTYLAWVDGAWPGDEAVTLTDSLERLDLAAAALEAGSGRKKVLAAKPGQTPQGKVKEARCLVRPLVRKRQATLLLVRLFTGRTHQIRVQLSTRGHAVISDAVYGRKVRGLPMLLHALCLRLPELALFSPPDWSGPFALPERLLVQLRAELAGQPPSAAGSGGKD